MWAIFPFNIVPITHHRKSISQDCKLEEIRSQILSDSVGSLLLYPVLGNLFNWALYEEEARPLCKICRVPWTVRKNLNKD